MKKLKKEIFLFSFITLTVCLVSIITLFFYQDYNREKHTIFNALKSAYGMMHRVEMNPDQIEPIVKDEERDKENRKENKMIFMDATIYTVLLDEKDTILDIMNHSQNSMDNKEIEALATKILKGKKKENRVEFLLLHKYSYFYRKGNSLIILDNTKVTNRLILNLLTYVSLLVIIEFIFFYLAKFLTKKITKPIEETFDKQRQFIVDASHELKTPLTVIMTSSEALEENPKEKKWLKNIKSETERMNDLIMRLLDLAATEESVEEEKTHENLSKIIELSVLTFESVAFEKKVELDYKIEENIEYSVHSTSIKQLVEILLDNAIKHAEEKSKISIRLNNKKEEIVFTVKNKGEGIPAGEEEKIFERFYRVDKARNREENRYGLGLAIAKNIVTSHHGEISAKSENGYTTFQVVFKKTS